MPSWIWSDGLPHMVVSSASITCISYYSSNRLLLVHLLRSLHHKSVQRLSSISQWLTEREKCSNRFYCKKKIQSSRLQAVDGLQHLPLRVPGRWGRHAATLQQCALLPRLVRLWMAQRQQHMSALPPGDQGQWLSSSKWPIACSSRWCEQHLTGLT